MFNAEQFSRYVRDEVIRGRSLRRAGQEVGVSASMLCRIQNGKLPSLDTLGTICRYMKVPIDRFFAGG